MRYAYNSSLCIFRRLRRVASLRLLLGLLWAPLASQSALASGVSSVSLNPPQQDYLLWYRNYDSPAIHALVGLALAKTPEYGEFRILRSAELSQGRALRELERGDNRLVDIINVAATAERESFLTPIPVPVDGGLLGFRVCVVAPEKLPLFEDIHSLADLRNRGIRIGQGAHWPDTSILRENQITVVTHPRYEILFGMLRENRFDCFARGVSEVAYDLAIENDPNLVIEPKLVLAYSMPSYLFVGPDDLLIAHRLQLGMERAIRDGSFGDFLRHYYGAAVDALNLEKRTMIVLDNPFLNDELDNVGRQTLNSLRWRLELLGR